MTNPDLPGRIVVVDDDPTVADVVGRYLVRDGHTVECVHDGHEALRRIAEQPPDLVVLDLMLPGIDGLEVCRRLRERWPIPVVMLTALGDETDRLAGFEIGADDYVTKPFSPRELVARVKALLRRTEPASSAEKPIEIGPLRIDPAAYRVTREGRAVTMSTLEFRLLYFLAARPNRVFTRDQLLDGVWGTDRFVTPRSVDVYVRRLREKIELDPQRPAYMKTIRGAGYLFETRAN